MFSFQHESKRISIEKLKKKPGYYLIEIKIEKMKPESALQKQIVDYFRENYPKYILFHIPNSATHFSKVVSSGVLWGVADLCLVLDGKVIFIELKSLNGRLSDYQTQFQSKCHALSIEYYVVRELKEFKEILKNNLPVKEWVDL